MRILITGITGQVGAALMARLDLQGTVIGADRNLLDLARPDTLDEALGRLAPDLIVNPAAYTAVDRAEGDANVAMRVNGEAPGILARWAVRRGVPLIHFSTDYVFDGSGDRAWREDDVPHPLSVYGATKLAGDNAVRGAGGDCLVIRTSWVYAAHGKNFLRTIARLARETKELRVVADQIGAPTSAALLAGVVAGMLGGGVDAFRVKCAEAGGLVNAAASGQTSWHGFACAIVDGLKARDVPLVVGDIRPIRSGEYATRAPRPRNSRLDLARLRAVFGIAPIDWRAALAPELDALALEFGAPGA